jgi:hypothetical protein
VPGSILARVDSLALALSLGAVLASRRARRFWGFAGAGVLVACAVLTKQTSLVVLPAVLVFSAVRGRRRAALTTACAFALVVLAIGIVLQIQSKGWFWYYVVELPATHGTKGREAQIAGFWLDELLRALPLASTVALLFLFGIPLPLARGLRAGHTVLALSLVLGAYAARIHMGSSLNDLMPAHAALALVFGITLHGMSEPAPSQRSLPLAVVALAQLALLAGSLRQYVPTRADAAAGQLVVDRIRETPGEVLVVNHPHLALLAGKTPYAHQMAFIDVFEAKRDPRGVRELLRQQWAALFSSHRFAMVILDNDWYVFKNELERSYVRVGRLPLGDDVLWPKTGTHFRPELVYVPKPSPVRPRGGQPTLSR